MQPDVVVIGGGAIGACSALELARGGMRVTLLERGQGLASGCSAGNAGLICPSHSTPLANPVSLRNGLRWMAKRDSPFFLKPRLAALPWLARFLAAARSERAEMGARAVRDLASASLDLHAALAAEGLDTGFQRKGLLNVYGTEEGLTAGRLEAEHSGLRHEVLDREGVVALEPALLAEPAGAVYFPDEAHCDPLRFVHAVGEAAAAARAAIRTGVEVRRLRRDGSRAVVETSAGDLRPGTVVLAAGAWSGALARTIGVFLPLEGGKGYHVDLEAAPGDPHIPAWLAEAWIIATPLEGRLRLAGTFELAGLDLGIDRVRVEAIRRAGLRGLRGLEGRKVVDVWAGLRPCTPDGLPVIGRAEGVDNLALATGHAMMGLSLAPVTGRLVAEMVSGLPSSQDLFPFRPDRFRPLLSL